MNKQTERPYILVPKSDKTNDGKGVFRQCVVYRQLTYLLIQEFGKKTFNPRLYFVFFIHL